MAVIRLLILYKSVITHLIFNSFFFIITSSLFENDSFLEKLHAGMTS